MKRRAPSSPTNLPANVAAPANASGISRRAIVGGFMGATMAPALEAAEPKSLHKAVASGKIYGSIAEGLAITGHGDQFVVWSSDAASAIVYLNSHGGAVEQSRIPTIERASGHVVTLAELKASAISQGGVHYEGSTYTWQVESAPYRADDRNIIKSDHAALSVGAWVRQSASALTFVQDGAGAIVRDVQDKLREQVSVLDYIPQEEHAAIRAQTSTYDCASAFQQAIDEARTIFVPNGLYHIGATVREATNGGARSIIGHSRLHTKIVANKALAARGAPIFWFGNSNGHGNYRLRFQHISLNGARGAAAGGAIAIRAHECGTSFIGDLYISGCETAIDAIGCIGSSFGGEKTEIVACQKGLWHSDPKPGVPANIDDITTTASPLSLKDNANRVSNFWFSKVAKPIRIKGGLTHIGHVVLQNCGNGNVDDLIHLLAANESYDYGGGPSVTDIWCEGGDYRCVIRVENTRDARIRKVFLSGSGPKCEQGIVVIRSKGCRVDDVAARGFWSRPPSEKRSGNYWLYVGADSPNGVFGPFYFTQNSCKYFVDRSSPRHNHIVIDNHRANNSTNGVIIGPIQICDGYIRKDPDLTGQVDLYIKDFSVRGTLHARNDGSGEGTFNADAGYRVNNQKVLGSRGAPIANAAGGGTVDIEARATINAMLACLRKHGLISS